MTRSLRVLVLLAVFVLLAARAASARIPDPPLWTVPQFIYVVGHVGQAAALDVAGAAGPSGQSNLIIVRDFAGNPQPGVIVHVQFPCDVRLCDETLPGQSVDCSTNTLSGTTDAGGRFVFVAVGAAADPGSGILMPGGGLSSTIVSSDEAGVVRRTTAICLDLDGAAPPGSNGTTMGDVGKELLTVLLALGAPPAYLGRADQNADGQLSAGDAATLITHAFRLMHAGGSTGCPGSYCNTIPCP